MVQRSQLEEPDIQCVLVDGELDPLSAVSLCRLSHGMYKGFAVVVQMVLASLALGSLLSVCFCSELEVL